MKKIENSVYRRVINDSDTSSFSGRGSLLYPLTTLYMDTGENSYEEKISGVTKFIMERIDNINNDDWLSGYAGILKNLVNLYKITEKAEYKKAAEEIGNRIDIERIKLGGFAHGYAGVSSSLFALSEISKKIISIIVRQFRP
ncbi:lanthionine synthetase LanC family protein [Bacillus cereus]